MKKNKKIAFTLAETLITLVIVGVVAALTVPSTIAKYKEQQTVSKLKKAYSTISQAYNLALSNDPDVDNWSTENSNTCKGAEDIAAKLKPYLSIMKDEGCTMNNSRFVKATTPLGGNGYYETLAANSYYVYNLQDGITMLLMKINSGFRLAVATDGEKTFKKPELGKNLFYLTTSQKIAIKPYSDLTYCKKNSTHSYNGLGCAGWVLTHENMDYPE